MVLMVAKAHHLPAALPSGLRWAVDDRGSASTDRESRLRCKVLGRELCALLCALPGLFGRRSLRNPHPQCTTADPTGLRGCAVSKQRYTLPATMTITEVETMQLSWCVPHFSSQTWSREREQGMHRIQCKQLLCKKRHCANVASGAECNAVAITVSFGLSRALQIAKHLPMPSSGLEVLVPTTPITCSMSRRSQSRRPRTGVQRHRIPRSEINVEHPHAPQNAPNRPGHGFEQYGED